MKYLWMVVFLFHITTLYAADMKITDLATDTTPDGDSLLVLVDEPAGSATNVNCTVSQLEAVLDHDALTNFTSTEHFTMLDEDNMASDDATKAASQQSIKVYVDAVGGDVTDVFDCASGDCNTILVETGESLKVAVGGEIEATEVILHVNNDSGAEIFKCTAVYISGFDIPSNLPEISIADADDAAKMPAIGLVYGDIANGADGQVITSGFEETFDTSGFTVGNSVYVNDSGTSADDTCSNTLTATRPANTDDNIQKMGSIMRVHPASGEIEVSGANRVNDVPNLDEAKIWVGNASNVATIVAMSGDVSIIADGTVSLAADSIDNGHINWADLDYLTDEGVVTGYTANKMAKFDSSGNLTGGGLYHYDGLWIDYPNSLGESAKRVGFGHNRSGQTFTITEMHVGASETILNAFAIYVNSAGDIASTSNALEAKATIDISGGYASFVVYDQTSGFDDPTVADDEWIVLDWDTGTPRFLSIDIWGYY